MTPRALAVIAGLAGYALFLGLFVAADRSTDWEISLDRNQAVQRARELAADLGVAASQWRWAVTAESDWRVAAFLQENPDDPAAPYLDPVRIGVWLRSPDGSQRLRLWLSPQGQLRESSWRGENTEGPPDEETALRLAREALARLVADPDRFSLLPDQPSRDDNELEFIWQLEGAEEHAVPRVEVLLRGSSLRSASLEAPFSEELREQLSDRKEVVNVFRVLIGFLIGASVLGGLAFYVSASFRRLADHRSLLLLLLVAALIHLVALVVGGAWDAENVQDDTVLEALLVGVLLLAGVVAPSIAGLWGGTFGLASSSLADKNLTMELLLQRGPHIQSVATSLLFGWAAGGYVAAVPYALAAWTPWNVAASSVDPGFLVAPLPILPALDVFTDPSLLLFAAIFAFWHPLLTRYLRPGLLLRTSQLLMGALVLTAAFVQSPLWAALVTGIAVAALSTWVYRKRDLLAVLAISPAVVLAKHAATHLVQPASGIQGWGLLMLALLAAMLPLLAWVSVKGTEIDMEHEVQKRTMQALRLENLRKAERDRLLAEFSVARRAQQQMLPSVPPQLNGYQLAALCHPAREVGGDFYDFVPLGPRLWGVAVADVSGKGVPAALYMTLTKGLLQSLGDHEEEPSAIVCEINRHLHAVARRSVFVTLALGVIDPDAGSITCFRAGHNPLIWRRTALRESRIVMPSGLGLGLTTRKLFERSLASESIRLAPGDTLFLFSDGIPEAMNREGEEYGDERLLETIARTDGLPPNQACELLLADVRSFLAGHPANDDITVVALRADPEGGAEQAAASTAGR